MGEYRKNGQEGKTVFVGVDLHRFKWHVTVRIEDQELFSGTIPGHYERGHILNIKYYSILKRNRQASINSRTDRAFRHYPKTTSLQPTM